MKLFVETEHDQRALCEHCGRRAGKHRGTDGKCPAPVAWIQAHPMSLVPMGEEYWSQLTTFFTARGGQ